MKRLTAVLLLSILTICLLSCSESGSDKKISLKFKYKPDMRLEYKQDSKQQTTVYQNDSVIEKSSDSYIAFINQEVRSVESDSTFKIYEEDIWRYTVPNKEDSTKKDTVEQVREMELFVQDNGKILDFEFLSGEKQRYSYIKNYYEQGLPIFPKDEVHTGYSWTQTTSVVLPNETMKASTTYKINSLVRELGYDCAIIKYNGNLIIPIEPTKSDSTNRSGLDKITTDGMIYFAYKEGIVIKQTEKWTTKGDRIYIKDGKYEKYNFVSDYDVLFLLTKAEGVK
ncbi:MAG: hypothetical protein DWP97_02305 [Calditrichaeota bacterium]|nr:MAG: hypothetical protein DWP97_02305 [Calditrichota bacterium]